MIYFNTPFSNSMLRGGTITILVLIVVGTVIYSRFISTPRSLYLVKYVCELI